MAEGFEGPVGSWAARPLAFVREFAIEWGHCDPAGIVFHPRYFEMFDACAAGLLQLASGMTKAAMLERYGAAGIPVVDAGAKFLLPCRHGDEVRIDTRAEALGRSSFGVRHLLFRGGALAVEGWSTRVWTARDTQDPLRLRAQPLPDELRARLGGAAPEGGADGRYHLPERAVPAGQGRGGRA